jgi:Tol biopolymer transport system component
MAKFLSFLFILFLAGVGCRTSSGPDFIVSETRNHVRPAWSPDGATIAFTGRFDALGIYLIDTSGANLRILVQGDAVGASWSPDNEWIAFSAGGNIYRIHVSGEPDSLKQLTTISGSIRPAWSKDGMKIAFVRITDIIMLRLDSGLEFDMLVDGDYPSWHSNGNEIVVKESGLIGQHVFTAVHDSSLSVRTLHSFFSDASCDFVSVSPDGNYILYAEKPEREYTQIVKVRLSTGEHTFLTNDGGDFPAWSPDGTKIVYTRTATGDGALFIMNADGTGKRRVTAALANQ